MSTDFNNKAVLGKPVYTGSKALSDLPLDVRTRIETIDEMEQITFPYIGMIIYVKDENKFYVVKTLKGKELMPGVSSTYIDNYLIDTYEEFSANISSGFPVFRDLEEANDFALTASNGDICHVQDYRTDEYKEMGINVFEESCYIDSNNTVQPIDSFSFNALSKLIDLLKDINSDIDATDKIDELKDIIQPGYERAPIYKTEPWNPNAYNEYQIALKMTKSTSYEYISSSNKFEITGANYEIEDITIENNEITEYYKVITLDSFPTKVSFSNGYNIEKVIHMCNTSNITNMNQMFMNCTGLTSINASDWDISNVTDMSHMFCECDDLETLDVNNWDTSNVTNMYGMFANCVYALKTLDLSNWNISNVIDMSYMFHGCKVLTTIGDVSNWNTEKARYMNRMFYDCNALTSLDVSNWNTSSVTNMEQMFANCKALESITGIQNWDTSNVTNMYGIFNTCSTLTELNISNWNTSKVTNMAYIFNGCTSLQSLDLSNFDTSNVTDMGRMFVNTYMLTWENIITTNCSEATITRIKEAFDSFH